jgi:hypothetical protein
MMIRVLAGNKFHIVVSWMINCALVSYTREISLDGQDYGPV